MKPSDTKIAFIGLGLMGVPMAKNLLKAGYQIAGFDLSKEVAAKFSDDKGFQFVSTPEQAIEDANITIFMLPDSSIIDAVLWGSNGSAGIASKLSKNSYLKGPRLTLRQSQLPAKDVRYTQACTLIAARS